MNELLSNDDRVANVMSMWRRGELGTRVIALVCATLERVCQELGTAEIEIGKLDHRCRVAETNRGISAGIDGLA